MGTRAWGTAAAAALLLAHGAAAGAARTPILGTPDVAPQKAAAWAQLNGATARFVSLAPLYWEVAEARGVRPEVAYAQAAKETNFGRFTGVLDASFHNPCGLKRTRGGSNRAPAAHMRFRSWRDGVTAQVDHLALYAGAPGYPRAGSPDPRAFARLDGTAPTVERLGGKWAPSRGYGTSLAYFVRTLLELRPIHEPRSPGSLTLTSSAESSPTTAASSSATASPSRSSRAASRRSSSGSARRR